MNLFNQMAELVKPVNLYYYNEAGKVTIFTDLEAAKVAADSSENDVTISRDIIHNGNLIGDVVYTNYNTCNESTWQ